MFEKLFTKENFILLFLVLNFALPIVKRLLEKFASKTDTKIDDMALKGLNYLEELKEQQWIKEFTPVFWNQVEALGKSGALGSGTSKLFYFLTTARKAFVEAEGKSISPKGEKLLETLAAGMSAEHKVNTNPGPAPAGE